MDLRRIDLLPVGSHHAQQGDSVGFLDGNRVSRDFEIRRGALLALRTDHRVLQIRDGVGFLWAAVHVNRGAEHLFERAQVIVRNLASGNCVGNRFLGIGAAGNPALVACLARLDGAREALLAKGPGRVVHIGRTGQRDGERSLRGRRQAREQNDHGESRRNLFHGFHLCFQHRRERRPCQRAFAPEGGVPISKRDVNGSCGAIGARREPARIRRERVCARSGRGTSAFVLRRRPSRRRPTRARSGLPYVRRR